MKHLGLLLLLTAPNALLAQQVVLPEGATVIEQVSREGEISVPVGQYGLVSKPSEVLAGTISRSSWVIEGTSSAARMLEQLIIQYQRMGYKIEWRCETASCGGYDFRYNIEASPPPKFVVNLDAFYYVDMRKGDDAVNILISSVDTNTYLQEIMIKSFNITNSNANAGDVTTDTQVVTETVVSAPATGNANGDGRWILSSVKFGSGGTKPSEYSDEEMKRIVDELAAKPSETVYIVGHSDETGGLSANLSVTKARAASVRQILIEKFNAPKDRVIADGVAFLAPIADNSTDAGRAQNRRVEAVFLTN